MVCKNCGKEFNEKYSKYSNGDFCCKECAKSFIGKQPKGTKIVHCIDCGKEIEVDKRASDKLCKCDNCRKSKKNKGNGFCKNCGKENPKTSNFCSGKCLTEFKTKNKIELWKNKKISGNYKGKKSLCLSSFVRRYIFEKNKNKCERCGWSEKNEFSKKIPLTIHHKNNNPEDSFENNLELLCPNCHSLTNSYGALNKGQGRKNRYRDVS